jgi:hypothetical protein
LIPAVELQDCLEVADGCPHINSKAIGITIIQVDPGVMEREHGGGQCELHGTWSAPCHNIAVRHEPVQPEIRYFGSDL